MKKIISFISLCFVVLVLATSCSSKPNYAGVDMTQDSLNHIEQLNKKTRSLAKAIHEYESDSTANIDYVEAALQGFKKASNDTFLMERGNAENLFKTNHKLTIDGKTFLENAVFEARTSIAEDAAKGSKNQKKIEKQMEKDVKFNSDL